MPANWTKFDPGSGDLDSCYAAAAGLILDAVRDGALFDNDAEGLEHRFQAEQQATKDADAAADGLRRLANERREADQRVATVLVSAASAAWSGPRREDERIGPFGRDLANERVADLFFGFASGDSPRGLVLESDDPFVSMLMRSEHVSAVRAQVVDDLRSGDLTSDPQGKYYGRSISNNGFVFMNDGLNLLSTAISGPADTDFLHARNLPELFLGSFDLDVFASEPAADGSVEVTYVINNDTTSDSFTRVPGSGGAHLPVAYPAMLDAEADSGDWASQHQTIVWTETVHP